MEAFFDALAPFWQPHPGQKEFLEHPSSFKVLACGRRWGKTDACAAAVLQALTQPSPTRHIIIAPTLDQAALLFERLLDLLEVAKDALGLDGKPRVRRSPYPSLSLGAHRVTARSGHLGRSLRGQGATHLILDEAAYLPEDLISSVAMPMLLTSNGVITMVSTPRGRNHFWKFFHMGQVDEHGVWSRHAPSDESPFVSKTFLAMQRDLVSDRTYRIEYGAEFLDDAGMVFPAQAVEGCITLDPLESEPPFWLGVDFGRYKDFTAVAVVCGTSERANLLALERFPHVTWAEQIARLGEIVDRYPNAILKCDQTGMGGPVIEQLRDLLANCTIHDVRFDANSKQGLIDGLSWIIERQNLRMAPHPELMRELAHFEATSTSSGHRRLGARSGYHDDLVIALALAVSGLPRPYRPQIRVAGRRPFGK